MGYQTFSLFQALGSSYHRDLGTLRGYLPSAQQIQVKKSYIREKKYLRECKNSFDLDNYFSGIIGVFH